MYRSISYRGAVILFFERNLQFSPAYFEDVYNIFAIFSVCMFDRLHIPLVIFLMHSLVQPTSKLAVRSRYHSNFMHKIVKMHKIYENNIICKMFFCVAALAIIYPIYMKHINVY
jgi:hypothetical protein